MPIYIFSPNIFEALEEINSGVNKEIQLTDGIQNIINKKLQVNTVVLNKNDVQLMQNWYELWSKGGAGPNFRIENPEFYIQKFNWIDNWISNL